MRQISRIKSKSNAIILSSIAQRRFGTVCGSRESLAVFLNQLENGKIKALHPDHNAIPRGFILLATPSLSGQELKTLHASIWKSIGPRSNSHLIGSVVDSLFPASNLPIDWSLTFLSENNLVGFKDIVAVSSTSAETSFRKFKSVGRWPELSPSGKLGTTGAPWEVSSFRSISSPPDSPVDDLKSRIPSTFPISETSYIITLSDAEPYEWMNNMSHLFPAAAKLGLITSPTPFITGKPNTLFLNNQILDSGCVSLLVNRSNIDAATSITLNVSESIEAVLSERLRIERCQGNIILELSSGSASKTLLDHAHATPDGKFAVRVFRDKGEEVVFKITGGDLAKGTLCVDTVEELHVGDQIELLKLVDGSSSQHVTDEQQQGLSFGCIPQDEYGNVVSNSQSNSTQVFHYSSLFAGSSTGFFFGVPGAKPHLCNVSLSSASI